MSSFTKKRVGSLRKLAYIKDYSTGIETISYEKVNIAWDIDFHL